MRTSIQQCIWRDSSVLFACVMLILLTHDADAFIQSSTRSNCKTSLKNKPKHTDYNDFASYDGITEQEKEVHQLTKEFYDEIKLRSLSDITSDETYESQPLPATVSPLVAFLTFLKPPPPPPSSAGLFSGRGKTAYSSGRSSRAEVQLLESSLNEQDSVARFVGWDGVYINNKSDHVEQILKAAAGTVAVLTIAYLVMDSMGGQFSSLPVY